MSAVFKLYHFPSKHFMIHGITNGVYAIIAKDGGAAISNAGIVDLGGQVVVFDTFLTPQAAMDLRLFVEEILGQKPQIVVNSHYHNDHIWGNQVFEPKAMIISSGKTRELISTEGMEEYQWHSANAAQKLDSFRNQFINASDEVQRNQLSMWIGYYEGLVEAMPYLSVCLPKITFRNRLELFGKTKSAQLFTYEGAHTGSDTVLYIPQDGIVFLGDLLFVGCHPYLADGDPIQLLKTLDELIRLGATIFVPGHGPVGTMDDLKLMIAYIEDCLDTAQMILDGGGDDEDSLSNLKIGENYEHWRLSQFYELNIRFLCQYLVSSGGSLPFP